MQRFTFFLLLVIALASQTHVFAQGPDTTRRVRVVGSTETKPKPRLITTVKQTRTTIALPKSESLESTSTIGAYEQEIHDLINLERKSRGLGLLVRDRDLTMLARAHSEDMALNGYFSHYDKSGNTVDGRALLMRIDSWSAIGENIAFSQGVNNPCQFTVTQWLGSKSHKKNLLNSKWVKTGVGVAVTKDGRYFFTQIFTR